MVVVFGETVYGMLMRGMVFSLVKINLHPTPPLKTQGIGENNKTNKTFFYCGKIQFPIFDYFRLRLNLTRDGTHTNTHTGISHRPTHGIDDDDDEGFSEDYGMTTSKHLPIRYYFDKCEIRDKCLLSTIHNRNSKW